MMSMQFLLISDFTRTDLSNVQRGYGMMDIDEAGIKIQTFVELHTGSVSAGLGIWAHWYRC